MLQLLTSMHNTENNRLQLGRSETGIILTNLYRNKFPPGESALQ